MSWDTLVVVAIVLAAGVYVARRYLAPKSGGCGCCGSGGSGCCGGERASRSGGSCGCGH